MLELKDISLTTDTGEPILSEINLCLMPNRINILLGALLSGKTTLMRVIAGLTPAHGEIFLHNKDITHMPVQKRNVAMVYQQFVNYPTMTVFDNIASPLVALKKSKAEIRERTEETAKLLKLTPFLARRPSELSGGQQQRVALARALTKSADITLLDEPLANLDYKLREELREEMPRLFAARGGIIAYATTDPAEAMQLGDNCIALHEGRVVQTGTAIDLYRNPDTLNVAEIFSDPPLNVAAASKSDGSMYLDGGNGTPPLPLPSADLFTQLADGRYWIAFRAHHVHNTKPEEEALSFDSTVQISEISGSESFIHLRVGGHDWVMQTTLIQSHAVGDRLPCHIRLRDIMIFDHETKRVGSISNHGSH